MFNKSKSDTYIHKITNNSNIGFSSRKYYYFLEKASCNAIIVLLLYCHYNCSLALSHSAVGSAAIYDCDIS